jgi:ribosomal protein L37E
VNEGRRTASTDVRCPRCGTRAIPILRGLPSAAAFEAADRGEIYLGGCAVTGEDPDFACTGFDCGLHFG